MRKICLVVLVLAISLMVSVSYAQGPRGGTSSEGKTGFTNVAVYGLNVNGVPGYIEFTNVDVNGTMQKFYVYVDAANGNLMIASASQLGTTSVAGDPQKTTWGNTGTVVGSQ